MEFVWAQASQTYEQTISIRLCPAVVAQAMADWPRWIENNTVDSSAMCIGYMEWVRIERSQGREPVLLPEIRHAPYGILMDFVVDNTSGVDLPWRLCMTEGCERCTTRRGGYKFRWYSHLWQDTYMKFKRPDSWQPEDAKRCKAAAGILSSNDSERPYVYCTNCCYTMQVNDAGYCSACADG